MNDGLNAATLQLLYRDLRMAEFTSIDSELSLGHWVAGWVKKTSRGIVGFTFTTKSIRL